MNYYIWDVFYTCWLSRKLVLSVLLVWCGVVMMVMVVVRWLFSFIVGLMVLVVIVMLVQIFLVMVIW